MFFVLSKIVWIVVQPLSLILLLMLVTLVATIRRWRRTGIAAVTAAAAMLFLLGYTSLGALLIQPLENRCPRPPAAPEAVSAIVVLGGTTSSRISGARNVTELNVAGDRMTEALRLARVYPTAPIIFSGGLGVLVDDPTMETEAISAQRFFIEQGIDAGRLVLEDQARNTAENVRFSKAMIPSGGGEVLLVTSAFHMPRSVGLFRQAGVAVTPWPVDYRGTGEETFGLDIADPATNMQTATTAVREWVGLVAYWATGRSDALFPSPK